MFLFFFNTFLSGVVRRQWATYWILKACGYERRLTEHVVRTATDQPQLSNCNYASVPWQTVQMPLQCVDALLSHVGSAQWGWSSPRVATVTKEALGLPEGRLALVGCRNECAESLTLVVGLSRPSLLVAGLTHPDGAAAPASLRHRHPVAGAGMAESLSTRAAVVLPLRLLKHFVTGVTRLKRQGERFFSPSFS